ncbi:MAG: zinc-ribbon domain-containing protein [Promethearchaeota archaeon]
MTDIELLESLSKEKRMHLDYNLVIGSALDNSEEEINYNLYCKHCGSKLTKDQDFCNVCGEKVI